MSDAKKILNAPFREWLADRFVDFNQQLRDGNDPSVIFQVNGVTCEIRLIDLPGEFTREDIPIEIVNKAREGE